MCLPLGAGTFHRWGGEGEGVIVQVDVGVCVPPFGSRHITQVGGRGRGGDCAGGQRCGVGVGVGVCASVMKVG